MAGVPVCLSDAEIADVLRDEYHPRLREIVRVPVEIALSTVEDAGDRLRASQMVVERIAGKMPDKLQHSGAVALSCADVYVHPADGPTEKERTS